VGHRQRGFLLAGAHGELALSGFERCCGESPVSVTKVQLLLLLQRVV
jgi:hypothetical protein